MILYPSHHELAERSRSHDFDAFCGSGAVSLRLHQRLRAPIWPALLFSFAWFYWRRLYLAGSLILMPAVLIADLGLQAAVPRPVSAILVVGLILVAPLTARRIHATAFLQRCDRADRLGLPGAERLAYLTASGGTSWFGGLLAGALWLSFAMTLLHAFLSPAPAALPS